MSDIQNVNCLYYMMYNTFTFDWFSNWVVIWYILFMLGIIPYNPSLILIICVCVIVPLLMKDIFNILYKNINLINNSKIMKITFMTLVEKIIPFLILGITNNIRISQDDVYFTLGIFIAYNLYLYMQNTNMLEVYK